MTIVPESTPEPHPLKTCRVEVKPEMEVQRVYLTKPAPAQEMLALIEQFYYPAVHKAKEWEGPILPLDGCRIDD